MITCAICGAKSTVPLCRNHSDQLRHMLEALTGEHGWLSNLADAALGNTRMGNDNGRRGGSDEVPIRVNFKASELLAQVRGTLARIVADLCESRSVDYRPVRFVRPDFVGPLEIDTIRGLQYADNGAHLVLWLLVYVDAIVVSEDAGQFYAEIDDCIEAIKRQIDRPDRRIWLGDCPTWDECTRQVCGVSLWATEEAVETQCQRCRRTHNCNQLRLMQFSDLEREKVPWEKILRANKSQPHDRQIPERTLQSWRQGKDGQPPRLKIRGYLRPNGRTGTSRHHVEDVPLYLWSDVRKLRDERPQKKPTGAAAHR